MTVSPISRRQSLAKTMQLVAIGGFAWATGRAANAQGKVAQNIAGYQDHPMYLQRCGKCSHYDPPNACKIVDGQISSDGWCKLFASDY